MASNLLAFTWIFMNEPIGRLPTGADCFNNGSEVFISTPFLICIPHEAACNPITDGGDLAQEV